SYTPTLTTLVRARESVLEADGRVEPRFVAVAQAEAHEGVHLRSAAAELSAVAERISSISSYTIVTGEDATVLGVVDALAGSQWLHMVCHGIRNRQQPFKLLFAMRDGPLTIKRIIQSDMCSPEFAFLSACRTTEGDESSPDEAIHLQVAAAMQSTGFRSVIGPMWSVDDDVAGKIISAFYDGLVEDSQRLDST
ncbi:hypothetical protein BS17DRAFT_702473, partial [Gyrodon lividus]